MAAAPQGPADPDRDSHKDQPDHPWLAPVLRGVLPLRAGAAPRPYQRLPTAMDPQEVQTAADHEEGPGGLATRHQPVPQALRPLGMGPHALADRVTRAG